MIRRALLLSFAMCTLSFIGGLCSPTALAGDLENGIAEYTQGHFSNAIVYFQRTLQSQPRNVSAALYLANCYYRQRQNVAAIRYYEWVKSIAPASRESVSASDMLQRLGVASPSQPANLSTSGSGVATAATHQVGSGSASDIEVVVVKAIGDHPSCTPEFIKSVKSAVKTFPAGVVALAARHKCKIYITPTMIDLHPELQNTQPSTYEQGHTYKNCPALFESPNIVVCEYAQRGENSHVWEPTGDSIGSLRHEFGHAVDAFMGYVTQTEEFRHQYQMERSRVTDPEMQSQLKYYVQEGRDRSLGASETFAEGCCILFGGSSSAWSQKEQTQFRQAFPNVLGLIKSKLNKVE